ncbi:Gfo/Idh/MocA family oxidoreductase [Candidatus Pelagibacter ubique]|jgi:predicted dehydrogenase|nr:Gfo/Idh/MocA family oxidoreductase [Candidatus Pelagibacter ubique]
MKVLIIGYGSVGRKHSEILSKNKIVKEIYIYSSQKIPKKFFPCKTYAEILAIDPDYIIISSVTTNHFKHLKFINKSFKNKIILVEKPLYEKYYSLKIKNNIFIGYNLRFHPVVNKVKYLIKNKIIYAVNIECFSNLIKWRTGRHYSQTSSAKKSMGGGVILDLSHEYDYATWLFGKLKIINFDFNKLSKLRINTEDYCTLTAKTENKILINISLNYFSLVESRKFIIFGNNFTLKADLLKNKIVLFTQNKYKKILFPKFQMMTTYKKMHESIINKDFKNLCTYDDGLKLTKFTETIKK